MKSVNSSYIQEVFPSTSLDESSIEFDFEMDRSLHLDMRDTHPTLKLQLFKGRFYDAFKKESAEHEANSEDDADEEPETYLTCGNNLLHSLFSNCEYNVLQRHWVIFSKSTYFERIQLVGSN